MCSKPVVIMTALELPFSFSAEEIFGLSTAEARKGFSTKCSQCVTLHRLTQKNLYYGKGKPTLKGDPVWFGNVTSSSVYMDYGPSHHTTHTRTEWYLKGG